MSDKTLRATAYHEAGHAVIGWFLGSHPRSASIVAKDDSRGHVVAGDKWLQRAQLDTYENTQTRMRMEKIVMTLLAGEIAQRRYAPRSVRSWSGRSDREKAADLVFRLAGMSTRAQRAYWNLLEEWTKGQVAARWGFIEAVASKLLERRKLSGAEIRAAIADYTGPGTGSAKPGKGEKRAKR